MGKKVKAYGPKELEEVVFLGIEIAHGVDASLRDGKFTTQDLVSLTPALLMLAPAIDGLDKIPDELKNMTEEDLTTLNRRVAERFNIDRDDIEGYIENALQIALSIYSLVQRIRKGRK